MLEFTSLVIAVAALLVSVSALYQSTKRAEIHVVDSPGATPAVRDGSWNSATGPDGLRIKVPILIYNTGARGGVLVNIRLKTVEDPTGLLKLRVEELDPIPVEPSGAFSKVLTVFVAHEHAFSLGEGFRESRQAFLEKVGALEDFVLKLEYEYVTGREWLAFKKRTAPKSKTATHDVDVKVGQFRQRAEEQWVQFLT